MGIFDRFRSKKEEEKKAVIEKERPKVIKDAKKGKKEPKPKREVSKGREEAKKILKKEENIAHRILIEPLVTEKSTSLGQFNKYVFKVDQKAGKNQIKEAVQDYYGVGVTGVNIVKIRPKKRMHGRMVGYKKGYKKAIVTLQTGDTIGITEGV